jgi:hypothetical protein
MAHPRQGARPLARFDDDEVHAHRQPRDGRAARKPILEQPAQRGAKVAALAVVERLFWEPEVAPPTPADLDDHEHRRRARVDRHEVELVATDMDVPGEDGPARFHQPIGDQSFGGITRLLGRRSRLGWKLAIHATIVAGDPAPALNRHSSGTYAPHGYGSRNE